MKRTVKPCHHSSSAFHTCDTLPTKYMVRFNGKGRWQSFRWCDRALENVRESCVLHKETVEVKEVRR